MNIKNLQMQRMWKKQYHIYPQYLDRLAAANSVDPDQSAPKEQIGQGLHCLASSHCFWGSFSGSLMDIFEFFRKHDKDLRSLNV